MVGREKRTKLKVRLPKLPLMAFLRRRSKEWNRAHAAVKVGPYIDWPNDWMYVCSTRRLMGWWHEFHSGDQHVRVAASDGWEPDTKPRR